MLVAIGLLLLVVLTALLAAAFLRERLTRMQALGFEVSAQPEDQRLKRVVKHLA